MNIQINKGVLCAGVSEEKPVTIASLYYYYYHFFIIVIIIVIHTHAEQ